MISTEMTPLLNKKRHVRNKKGHVEIYIWISNVSQAISVADVNSISSRSEFGHVALRLFNEKGEGISYADNGYISLYPSAEKNENFIFKSPHQDFHSGSMKKSPPNKIYKINQINFRAIQEKFKKIKANNNIRYSCCFFNGKETFNCAELALNLLIDQGEALIRPRSTLTDSSGETLISVIKNYNNKIGYTLFMSCRSLLICGLLVFVIFIAIGVALNTIILLIHSDDLNYLEYKKNCEPDFYVPATYVVNNGSDLLTLSAVKEYNCSGYVPTKIFTQLIDILLEVLVGAGILVFLIGGIFICRYWASYAKNAMAITPGDVNDLLASAYPGGSISEISSFDEPIEEKNIQASCLGSQLHSIKINSYLSRSPHTLISSWNANNQATNKQIEINEAGKKEEKTNGLLY